MNWIKFNADDQFGEKLKVGTIIRIEEDIWSGQEGASTKNIRYGIVGTVNETKGTNDEFTEEGITHYTEDFIPRINQILNEAKEHFENNKIK